MLHKILIDVKVTKQTSESMLLSYSYASIILDSIASLTLGYLLGMHIFFKLKGISTYDWIRIKTNKLQTTSSLYKTSTPALTALNHHSQMQGQTQKTDLRRIDDSLPFGQLVSTARIRI